MARITEIRLTLAAFIYGIEIDLKNAIKKYITPFQGDLKFIKDSELEVRILDRFRKDNPGVDFKNNIDDVVDYIDFYDSFNILNKNCVFLPKPLVDYLKSIFQNLTDLIPVRNRVMHTRPLLGGDFSAVYDFIQNLKHNSPIDWKFSIDTRDLIEKDPSYILTLRLPQLANYDIPSKVVHNLPIPDFDDTGFIGRTKDVDEIKKLIFSNKVVSILGDGGIGKTALAVKIAYDLVDMGDKCPFELIIWTSAKTTMLTSKGIEEIYTAITDYTGLISIISDTLDSSIKENKIDSILEYLELFKTLIIIDNLETIQSEEVRNFIRNAQTRCNIVITSRIGLGELEYPRTLSGLTDTECAKLIREIARIRNSDILMKLPQSTLIEIASKLYYNPLALKWFVSTVETGISPQEVLNNKDDLLNFCLTNVYEKLSEGAISVLNSIRASRRKLSSAEILYLSDYDTLEARKFLIELFKTTLISREIIDATNLEEVYYYIPEFAKEFLSQKHPVEQEFVKKITRKSKELNSGIQDIKKINSYNEFSINALSCETPNQRIAAKLLSEALNYSRVSNYTKAYQKVNEARNVDPNYYEVYRVSAFMKATNGDTLSADDDYLLGLEIAPENPRLLFFYAQFLLFHLEDTEKALEYAQKLHKIKPEHPYTSFLFARCYNTMKEYNKAIQIIRNLISKTELDPQNLRVAYTELISLYAHNGQSYLRVENDIDNGISHFKKSFETFDKCDEKGIVDIKMIKNFCEALHTFISMIPATEVSNSKAYIKEVILAHQNQISLIYLNRKLIFKYAERFEDDSLSYLLDAQIADGTKIGNLIKGQSDTYVFIESESERYFAHYSDFADLKSSAELKKIKHGQLVSFEEGINTKGPCAKNVKIVESVK
ncbi:NB-ARC domain-containing protein [Rufibacter quisquiliarum]|uniref:Tetratricopeptide (TPR) repeat protein/cold shock CspA family protein n=1 Tax=Rufibacter quisquiliarum TaxID=1549639 RepID=A0A839GUV4_9BACT|nr:NB-ARC domain-containing protein [Rufibacter quisquiliarum]MBA9078208.1 tetratricopeptide (TPR) repeat protein/cold shock CspA family protein [Rufibacter quisquiliarum]